MLTNQRDYSPNQAGYGLTRVLFNRTLTYANHTHALQHVTCFETMILITNGERQAIFLKTTHRLNNMCLRAARTPGMVSNGDKLPMQGLAHSRCEVCAQVFGTSLRHTTPDLLKPPWTKLLTSPCASGPPRSANTCLSSEGGAVSRLAKHEIFDVCHHPPPHPSL